MIKFFGTFPSFVAGSAGLSSDEKCVNFNASTHLISFNLLVMNSDNGFCDLIQCSTHIESVKPYVLITCKRGTDFRALDTI